MSNFLTGTIDRFEGDFAIIILKNEQTLNWPKEKIDPKIKEGDKIKLFLSREIDDEDAIEVNAKQILDEILQNN